MPLTLPCRALQHTNLLQCLAQCAEVTPYLLVMEFCPLVSAIAGVVGWYVTLLCHAYCILALGPAGCERGLWSQCYCPAG